ncbi:MAG: Uma2 family endonuclease [Bryobacterales bacterium]|nr:Uma2 family endonuclease [Bryobacterales bacterium]
MYTVSLPELKPSTKLRWREEGGISNAEFEAFCQANPDLRAERTPGGEIVIMAPAGGEGSFRSGTAFAHLRVWAEKDGRGEAFDASAGFMLPDRSSLSPDAAWVSHKSLQRLTPEERKKFLRLCPEFVIEVMSPSDNLKEAKAKMEAWIANGAKLGWLIDGDHRAVFVYRSGRAPKALRDLDELAGEGPVQGFILPLQRIWQGLS